MNELNRVREDEETNFQTSRAALGDTYALLAEALALYDLLGELVDTSRVSQRDDIITGVVFLLACRYALMKSMLELMRAHMVGDSLVWVRGAVEQAGFADVIRRDPALAMTWLNAVTSDAGYRAYKEAFKTKELFPKTDPLMDRLFRIYDFTSQRIHASPHAFATRLRVSRDKPPGKTEIRYDYFDVRAQEDVARIFMFVLNVHLDILRVFERVLADAVAHDPKRWQLRFNSVEAAIEVHKRRWAPALLAQLEAHRPANDIRTPTL